MTEASTRTLVLLRHAKAADPDGHTDRERPLTERGLADAAVAGEWLKSENLMPTQVLCSPSLRTRQTWGAVVEASGQGGLVDHDPRIYAASERRLLEIVRESEPGAGAVALVGHAPSIAQLTATLDDGRGDAGAYAALEDGFPTCTAAVFRVATPWADLAPGAAELLAVRTFRA